MSVVETTKSFVSGLFAGMANDQAKRRDYQGTKWRADIAMRWASHPYSKFFAHAVSAKAEMLGSTRMRARHHVDAALRLLETNEEIGELEEVRSMAAELTEMRNEL
jgi:hypothetical protein